MNTTPADVATNLRAIEEMAGRLQERAIDRATARDMPGGDAMVALGSVGSLTDWNRRVELAEAAGDYDKATTEDPDRMWPAIQTLWFWSENVRATLGHNYDDPRWRPTLVSEARFLRNRDVADWIWEHEPNWDSYAKDVGRAKARLETILLEGEHVERTRVVCGNPECDDPRSLIRVYAKRSPVEWACEGCGDSTNNPDPCEGCGCDALTEVRWESDPEDDTWKCGTCKKKFTHKEVRDFYAKQLRLAPAERWVPTTHAVQLMRDQGWQERVVRSWFSDETGAEVEVRIEATSGQRSVLWSTLWRRHLLERNIRDQAKGRQVNENAQSA